MSQAEAQMSNLSDLTKLSKTLNDKSDQVNQILQDLEEKLGAMNLGVEAWLTNEPLSECKHIQTDPGDGCISRYSKDEILGYGRHGGKRALLVKTLTWRDKGEDDWEIEYENRPTLLLQASRELRIGALGKLESLIEALERETKKIIDSIEKGEKVVEKL